ncbi:hypothetical protein [uncultured Paludibaculum sp.]|uniref:hypothetical protein n=1 Tax=uncultured Paludibaculum sp. TaxID=1765020 RepID=UPI002AABA132|nr:hypothetical protein [uncultured Paludibaculum sp.]
MKQQYLATALVLLVFALLGFFVFPGHTWLQSDTQIYAPMIDRLMDPALFPKDELALRPHVTWTLYDEIAIGLRHITGLDLQAVLAGQQIVFRFVGLAGAFLLAQALGLGVPAALFAAGCFGLGATINGPAVLTLEYEPVPRAFAILLVMGALGCAAQRYWRAAAVLAFVATIYHPTSTAPFWACAALYFLVTKSRRDLWPLAAACAASVATVLLFAIFQHGSTERQVWFGIIPPQLEVIQKFRARYNWIRFWPASWFWQYPLLLLFTAGAWLRVRTRMTPEARFFTLAAAVYGMVMVPVQYVLLDVEKWVLMPQFQPARAVLFITAMAILLGIAAGWHAAAAGRRLEALGWLAVVFAIPANGLVVQLITQPDPKRLTVVFGLAAATVLAASRPRIAVAIPLAAIFLIPDFGGVQNYPALHTVPLRALSDWARSSTSPDKIFLFADIGHGLQPGVFRNDAKRSIYVDWKGGGQANLLENFADVWWRRWQAVHEASGPLRPLADYGSMGIDYIVVRPANKPVSAPALYENSDWAVLATQPAAP